MSWVAELNHIINKRYINVCEFLCKNFSCWHVRMYEIINLIHFETFICKFCAYSEKQLHTYVVQT